MALGRGKNNRLDLLCLLVSVVEILQHDLFSSNQWEVTECGGEEQYLLSANASQCKPASAHPGGSALQNPGGSLLGLEGGRKCKAPDGSGQPLPAPVNAAAPCEPGCGLQAPSSVQPQTPR